MSLGRNVQFRSADSVIAAYRANDVPCFAVSAGTQLLTSYNGTDIDEGAQLLEKFLELLEDSKSAATYSVRVYKKLGAKEDISNKTPYHGSFNFNLTDTITGALAGIGANNQGVSVAKDFYELRARFDEQTRLLEMMAEKLENLEQPEPVASMGETMLAALLPHLPAIIEKFLPKQEPGQQQISGISLPANLFSDNDVERIGNSLIELRKVEKDVPKFLERLAAYANRNPNGFAFYKKYL